MLSNHRAITSDQPGKSDPLSQWILWFTDNFLPAWIEHTRDPEGSGFYDLLDSQAQPVGTHRRTVLAQARLLFTFSHLALKTNHRIFVEAAKLARDTLPHFLQQQGGYCRAIATTSDATIDQDDNLIYSYDQSFVILGLCTWQQLPIGNDETEAIEACWSTIENQLTDAKTGLLLEHNKVDDAAHASAPPRAQNPHMHLYEAALQAFEMSGQAIWLQRAKQLRCKGLEYFHDRSSGTIIEFIAPQLTALPGREGQRREIGHQCEWAWLLYREAELSGDDSTKAIADQLLRFADNYGFATTGPMRGAAFDAVSSDTQWREESFLLWPQTEAIKTYAIRSDSDKHADNAKALMLLVFQQYFADQAAFINQLDNAGAPLWPEALSRLLYHLVLAVTEGSRAGLWR